MPPSRVHEGAVSNRASSVIRRLDPSGDKISPTLDPGSQCYGWARSVGGGRMQFLVLGPLEVREDQQLVPLGSGRQRSLLGVLLLHPNETVSVDRLVDELWGESPPAHPAKLVQGYVSGLRKRLGADRVLTKQPGYLVRVGPSELDSQQFERLVVRARSEPPQGAAPRLREALALWRGPALADVRLVGLAAHEAERLNGSRVTALLDRIDAELALGRHGDVVGELKTLIAEHQLQERLRGQLMLALYRSGRQAEALEAYLETREVLSEELGIEPGEALRSLHTAILRQDPELGGTREPDDLLLRLPEPIRRAPPFPFVGRSRELATLHALVPRPPEEGRRLALIGGEAGSGKSRLVREFAHEAAAEGIVVLYGACDAVVQAPYRPFVDALGHLVEHSESDVLLADLGPMGGELTRILPRLAQRLGGLPDPVAADPDTERHRLQTAITDLLTSAGRRWPLVLALEDIHWADTPTLILLRHLARAPTDARVLVIATFRGTEAEMSPELIDTLAELRRSDGVARINLTGLTQSEIEAFVSAAVGVTGPELRGLAHTLYELTGGNPFLLSELWRMLAETGIVEITDGTIHVRQPLEEIASPEGVREVVRQRLSWLPPDTRDLLDLAAVAGPEFELETLGRAARAPAQAPTGTVTFLFTDIEGSTALVRRLGDRYPELLAEHDRLLADAFGGRGGHQVDRQGDALFFTFRRARDAVQAAAEAQRSVADATFPEGVDVRIRIGIHTGEPGLAATGYHGLGVVKAARISDAAHGGQILVSAATRTLLRDEPLPGIVLEDLGDHRLKDFEQPERLYQIVADRLERHFPPLRADHDEALDRSAGADQSAEPRRVERRLPSARGLRGAASHPRSELPRYAANLSALAALAALEPAERSGMIEEIPSRNLAFRFTHELVRRALYDRISGPRRAELHLRVGEALEAVHRSPQGRVLTDLARHFSVAAPIGGRERAVEYNLLAADASAEALAFDQAAAQLRTALDLGIDDERQEAEVRLELGGACVRSGESLESIQAYREAAEIARRVSDGELLARAAVGFEEACWRPGMLDRDAVELLEEASMALPPSDSGLRVRVLAGLARALAAQGDHSRAAIVRSSAIAMARRLDDRQGLATVLMHAYWARGATPLEDVLRMLTESRDLAAEMGDVEIQAQAIEWRVLPLMALGHVGTAKQDLRTVTDMAERVRQPFVLHIADQYRAAIALLEGRLHEAETAAERSREWGRLLRGRDASGTYGIQMFGIRREQGRLAELAPVARSLAAGSPGNGVWRPAVAALLAELGMVEGVERELAHIRREGLDPLRHSLWLGSLIYLTDACSSIGEREVAALVYPELTPFGGTNVMIGSGVIFCGAADRYLGMLAATLGDVDAAEGHFAAALRLNRDIGAITWLAHTCYEYARMLMSNDQPGRAEPLIAEAQALAERVGMPALLDRIGGVRSMRPRTPPLPDGLTPREVEVLVLVSRGRSNREIASALSLSEHTAANHVKSILRKTRCANRTEAASYAHERGLVEH
jgi:class 3 adenylate cyclase/DNA-binding SARP family transcriptional activator/DNA-binding CsgD family transcriptional regulator/tetratricopeptide (TPR) repeat protein